MKQILFLILIISTFQACSQSTFQAAKLDTEKKIEPNINEQKTEEIGNSLFTEYFESKNEILTLQEIPDIKFLGSKFLSERFILVGSDKGVKIYYGENVQFPGIAIRDNSELSAIIYKSSTNGRHAMRPLSKQVKYDLSYESAFSENNYKQEFLYSGKSGSVLKFTYREFSGNMIRPAFNQEVQYDLNEGNVVGFRKLRIEVIEATNTNITYKLISPF